MFFFFLASLGSVLLRNSHADANALLYARLFYFCHMLAVGYTAAFVGIHFHGFQIMRRRGVNLLLQGGLLVGALVVALLVNEVEDEGAIGTVVESPEALEALAFLAFAYGSTAMAVLVKALLTAPDAVVRRQALLMTIGVGVHGGTAATYSYLRLSTDAYPPPVLAATAAFMALLIALAVVRYRLFSLSRSAEGNEGGPPAVELGLGRVYVIHQRTGASGIDVFAEAVRRGRAGLCVTRLSPERVRDEWGLRKVPILWLTGTPGQNNVPPTHLDLLIRLVEGYLGEEGTVVLLEGVEYLLQYVSPKAFVRFHQRLVDSVVGRRSTLIVAMDPEALDPGMVAEVEREAEVIDLRPRGELDEIFVIQSSGILVAHAGRRSVDKDEDKVAGVFRPHPTFAPHFS